MAAPWLALYFHCGVPGAQDSQAAADVDLAVGYRRRVPDFHTFDLQTLGVSAQSPDEQPETAQSCGGVTTYQLLASDADLSLAGALGLSTFQLVGRRWYERLAALAYRGVIARVLFPVSQPCRNPDQLLTYVRRTPPPYEPVGV